MRALAEYAMRDRKHAIFLALLFAFLPLCGWLSLSIIALVTLRRGAREGAIVLAWAALPALIVAILGKPIPLVNDVVLGSVLVWGMANVLRATYSWVTVLQLATLTVVTGLLIIFWLYPSLPDWWEQRFNLVLSKLNVATWDLSIPETAWRLMAHDFAQLATGIYGIFIITGNMVSLIFARWMQALLYNPGALRQELSQIRLSPIASMVFIVVLLGVITGNIIAINTALVMASALIIASISLFHRLIALTAKQHFWLIGFYTLLILFFPYIVVLLLLIALVDSWIDIHKQLQLKINRRLH